MSVPSIRATVRFRGRVQGVGFRARTLDSAKRRAVSGYVRNLTNGDVELTVEGKPIEIDGLVADICRRMAGHIEDWVRNDGEATGEFVGFEIRR